MRVLIVSDTHGEIDSRIAALASACDHVLHAGDIGHPDVLAALRPRVGVLAVRGNNDVPRKWPQEHHGALGAIPAQGTLALPGGLVQVVHGHTIVPAAARHHLLRDRFADARAVVYRHSHRLVVDTEALPWILNPGAAGRERTFGGPSCLVLEADVSGWRVEALRFPLVRRV